MKTQRHSFGVQCLPLKQNVVVCIKCGKKARIGDWPTGKRSKCVKGRTYQTSPFKYRKLGDPLPKLPSLSHKKHRQLNDSL